MNRKYSIYVTRWETCRLRHVEANSEEDARERGPEMLADGEDYESVETGIDHVDTVLEEE
jgi:hypothetical protein